MEILITVIQNFKECQYNNVSTLLYCMYVRMTVQFYNILLYILLHYIKIMNGNENSGRKCAQYK